MYDYISISIGKVGLNILAVFQIAVVTHAESCIGFISQSTLILHISVRIWRCGRLLSRKFGFVSRDVATYSSGSFTTIITFFRLLYCAKVLCCFILCLMSVAVHWFHSWLFTYLSTLHNDLLCHIHMQFGVVSDSVWFLLIVYSFFPIPWAMSIQFSHVKEETVMCIIHS